MKVYRGYDKQYGPITHHNWVYVSPSMEQAKWYATKDGDVNDGSIIEYDMDKDNLHWISLSKINSMAEDESEEYSEEDLLWYQEDLANSLNGHVNGIYFTDPYKKDHTIYILLDDSLLKNPRELSKEEVDSIQLNESLILNEYENLSKFNRIAGFYHWDTEKFEFFPRTTEDISTEDDEINDYIHNVTSKDELTEFKIVRFGIEDIPGEGRVCYIEADTKRNAEQCYYTIVDEYQEDLRIEKYELEYYVGNQTKFVVYDMYGDLITESANPKTKKIIAYHGSVEDNLEVTISTEKGYNKAFYLTNDKDLAKKFAYREVMNDGLYEGEIPILYTYELNFKNPYYLTQEEYDNEGQDSNIDVQKWIDSEYDGIIFNGEESGSTYYICFREGTYKLINKEYLPHNDQLDEGKVVFKNTINAKGNLMITRNMKDLKDLCKKIGLVRAYYDLDLNAYVYASGYWVHSSMIKKMVELGYYAKINPSADFGDIHRSGNISMFCLANPAQLPDGYNITKMGYKELLKADGYHFSENNDGVDLYMCVYRNNNRQAEERVKNDFSGSTLTESLDLDDANRIAGFYFYKKDKWQLLKRKNNDVDYSNDKVLNRYGHDVEGEWLDEHEAIRFTIHEVTDNYIICIIESPYKKLIKPFIKTLSKKFPEAMAMVTNFSYEWHDGEDGMYGYKDEKVLSESVFYDGEVEPIDYRRLHYDVRILKNPTHREIDALLNKQPLRFLITKNELFVWDAMKVNHKDICDDFGLTMDMGGRFVKGKKNFIILSDMFYYYEQSQEYDDKNPATQDELSLMDEIKNGVYDNIFKMVFPNGYVIIDEGGNEVFGSKRYGDGDETLNAWWDGKNITESVVDAIKVNQDKDVSYLYKNPTMKELRDDGNTEYRVTVYSNDFYFGDAGYWIHEDMLYDVDEDDYERLYYDLNKNTFYMDFTASNDEEYNEMYNGMNESLHNDNYLTKTFGNFTFKLFNKNEVDSDTPFGLVESKLSENIAVNYSQQQLDKAIDLILNGHIRSDLFDIITDDDIYYCYTSLSNDEKQSIIKSMDLSIDNDVNSDDYVIGLIVDRIYDCVRHNRPIKGRINDIMYNSIHNRAKDLINDAISELKEEFNENDTLYRCIYSSLSPEQLIEHIQEKGVGNCWAKKGTNYAESYNGGMSEGMKKYVFVGETSEDNIAWITTAFLRVLSPQENEIRLKKNGSIQIKKILVEEDGEYIECDISSIKYIAIPIGNEYYYDASDDD